MSNKHTAGNWSAKKITADLTHFYSDIDCDIIFSVTHNEETIGETDANNKLIAAAPELLEALFEAKRCLVDRIRIQYIQSGANDETAERMANVDIQKFLLFNAINKATI